MECSSRSGSLLAITLLLCLSAAAAYTPPGKGEQAVRSDIKYIRCQTCEALAKNALRQVKALRDGLPPKKQLEEFQVIEMMENIANPAMDEGEWITKIDLVEKGRALKLVEQEQVGECGSECKTIQKAAEEVTDHYDTDMAEALWQGKMGRAAFTNWLCYELSDACSKKAPKLPADRKAGPAFKAADPNDAHMAKMMAKMKASGLSGQMYDRNEAMKMAGKVPGMDDDDDDEDEAGEAPAFQVEGSKPASTIENMQKTVSDSAKVAYDKAVEVGSAALSSAEPLMQKAKEGLSSAFQKASDVVSGFTKQKAADAKTEL